MIESELVEKAAELAGVSRTLCRHVFDELKATILAELATGGTVRLCGMGEFKLKLYPPRTNRHPQTGVMLEVPAKIVPAFAPSKVWKQALNEWDLAERMVEAKRKREQPQPAA